jgi:hypothetical protein
MISAQKGQIDDTKDAEKAKDADAKGGNDSPALDLNDFLNLDSKVGVI